ncbi:MAG: hypothetical protein H0W42_12215 [Gemmatimonadaceae bacterium]|nr:hypothetical protein [Gemmatimonadaceae bacterium]
MLLRNRRALDAERREFAAQAMAVVRRHAKGERFDAMAYARTMRDLGPILDEFYGAYQGDLSGRFGRLILNQCRAARGLAFGRAVRDVRQRLKREPVLARLIERESRGS